jgi:hypothetical protein
VVPSVNISAHICEAHMQHSLEPCLAFLKWLLSPCLDRALEGESPVLIFFFLTSSVLQRALFFFRVLFFFFVFLFQISAHCVAQASPWVQVTHPTQLGTMARCPGKKISLSLSLPPSLFPPLFPSLSLSPYPLSFSVFFFQTEFLCVPALAVLEPAL